jgi:hypothetical protein
VISDLPIIHNKDVKLKDENKKQLWTFLVLYFINKNQYINDTYGKLLFTPRRTMHILRIMLYDQPALSPLAGISFIVLLYAPYKWILCLDICCMQIGRVD